MPKLISFDIDGTLELGDPPGFITMDMVRKVKEMGYVIGSASDRTLDSQQQIWNAGQIAADFMVLKHDIGRVMEEFEADAYYHIGDTDMDQFYSERAGFRFLHVDSGEESIVAADADFRVFFGA